jgi:hypothetical protein
MMVRALAVLGVLVTATLSSAAVPTPDEHLGRKLGGDFTLADWKEVSSYYGVLAKATDRVRVEKIGTSTEGRDFLMATISSPQNLAHLEQIQAAARTLADPRGKSDAQIAAALRDGKPILMMSLAMHSTECAGTQFGMLFAHQLATSDEEPYRSAREKCVVVMFPCTNPDGLDHVVDWYRKTVNTPYENSSMLRLYQLYTGHDNNRDWFMLTQPEARLITRELYHHWFPHIYWDVHQQGGEKERFFVPPYRDPLDTNLDAGVIAATYALGQRAVLDLTREGFTGVSTGSTYDMWFHGGNRGVPVRHNIIGILTEAASCNIASPVFVERDKLKDPMKSGKYQASNNFLKPWPGGWWRLRDIIDYEMAFGRSVLSSVTREPELYLRSTLEAAQRSIANASGGPRAWVIPADNRDPAAVKRMIDALMLGGVEVHTSEGPVKADGLTYPAGSIVIRRDQPYGTHVKDLFDIQHYPEGDPPYDIAGWTLPALMGVRRVEVMHGFEAAVKLAGSADEATARFAGEKNALANTVNWTRLAKSLQKGETVYVNRGVAAVEGPGLALKKLPRIGVYAAWAGDVDEGWMRYVLELVKVPYVSVRPETVRAGELLREFDVLIFPGTTSRSINEGRAPGSVPDEFAGGLGVEGNAAIDAFVRGGGTLIAVDNSAKWAIGALKLPVTDATSGEGFNCPGSVLRTVVQPNELTAGLPGEVPVMFSKSSAFKESTKATSGAAGAGKVTVLSRYAPSQVLLSGWIAKPEVIEGTAAWVRIEHGAGRVHLFGYRPQYRAGMRWWRRTSGRRRRRSRRTRRRSTPT